MMKRVLTVMEAIGEYLKTLLFDINFNRYISLQIIPLCYISVLILTAGGLLWLIVHGFMDNIWLGFFYLCLSPLLFLLCVSGCRMILELLTVIFRITVQLDEVAVMRESLGEVTALTRPLSRLFQRKPVRPVQSTRQDTPPPTNNRR